MNLWTALRDLFRPAPYDVLTVERVAPAQGAPEGAQSAGEGIKSPLSGAGQPLQPVPNRPREPAPPVPAGETRHEPPSVPGISGAVGAGAPPQPVPGQYDPTLRNEGGVKLSANSSPAVPVLALAVPLIQHYEACKLAPYLDAKGIATIGWGNTRWKDGSAVRMSDRSISMIEADDLFAWWLAKFDAGVVAMLPGGSDAGTHAAFLSFAYNVGLAGAENSATLKRLHAGDKPGAAAGLALWNKSGGKVLKGLQRRRHAEGLVMQGSGVKAAIIKAEAVFP